MWPAIALLGASMFVKHQNERAARKRQERLADAMHAFQRQKAAESEAAIEALVSKQTPEARGTELADLTRDREHSLRDTVGAAQGFDAPAIAGKLSSDYRATSEAEANRRAETLRRSIEQLATMGAPGEQGLKHNIRFSRAAGTVEGANNAMESVGRAYATDIDSVRANPFLSMLSNTGMMVGGAMLGGAGGAAAAGAAPSANNGQGYEDASGNLYNESVTNAQDERIRRQLALRRGFSLWGEQPTNAR